MKDVRLFTLLRPEHRSAHSRGGSRDKKTGIKQLGEGLPKFAARSPKRGGIKPHETLSEWQARWDLRMARIELRELVTAHNKAVAAMPPEPTEEQTKEYEVLLEERAQLIDRRDQLKEKLDDVRQGEVAEPAEGEEPSAERNAWEAEEQQWEFELDECQKEIDEIDTKQEKTYVGAYRKLDSARLKARMAVLKQDKVVERLSKAAMKARETYKVRLKKLGL